MTRLQEHIHSLQTARRMTLGLLEGISPKDWLHQPVAGGQHVLWIVVHLTIADDWALVSLGRDRLLSFLDERMDKTRPIVPDAAAYPSIQETRELFDSAHTEVITRLGEISEADLSRATTGAIAEFAPNLATLLISHAWHEGFHGGQLALIRRSLGMGVKWG